MLISFGFDIALRLESEASVLFYLKLHPSRFPDLLNPEHFEIEPKDHLDEFLDHYGNRFGRVHCKPGTIRFTNRGMIRDSGEPDAFVPQARQEEIFKLPPDAMVYLLPSRYCESDSELASFAWEKFGPTQTGLGACAGHLRLRSSTCRLRL